MRLLLLLSTVGAQLVWRENVTCINETLTRDERPGAGEYVEIGGGWVPNFVRVDVRAQYVHQVGGDNSSKLAKKFCAEIGASIATIYDVIEDQLAWDACRPADCWIGLEEDGGVPLQKCAPKCGTADTWWGEQVWLWPDGWRSGGPNEGDVVGYENWNRYGNQPDNGKAVGTSVDERHATIAGHDGHWYDVLGTTLNFPLCRMWPNATDGFVWNGTDCKPKRTPAPTQYNVLFQDPQFVWGGFLLLVFHACCLSLLYTLARKVEAKRERTKEHYYYGCLSTCCSILLFIPFPPYALIPLVTPCDKYRNAVVPEGSGGPESLLDDGKSTCAQYCSAFVDLVQACTWALGVPCTLPMSRSDFLASRYNDFGGAAYRACVDLKLRKEERVKWLDAWGSIDADAGNSMDAAEFFSHFDFAPDAFARRLYDIYDAKKTNGVPFSDFLVITWRLCNVSRASCEEVAFRLLRRSSRFHPEDSTLDVRDVQRFVEHRYGFSKSSAKKKSLQIFAYLDEDGSGGIDFKEFAAFGQTNPVFLAVGHRMQTKLRAKLFGVSYWRTQTKKRRDRYAFDGPFEKAMAAYVTLRYGDSVPKFGERTPRTKTTTAAVDFWAEFPEVYSQVLKQLKQDTETKTSLASAHRFMRAELHQKLMKAVETLFGDARSLGGAFARWRSRTIQQQRLLRDVDSATGTSLSELGTDDAVHAGIIGQMNRCLPSHEVREATLEQASDVATKKRSKRSRLAAAHAGTLRASLGDHTLVEDGHGWRERESVVSLRRSSSLKSRSRIRPYYDDDESEDESAASFLYEDDGSVMSKLTL